MARLLVGHLIGLLIGGALTFYLFVGVPRSGQAPGIPIQPPDANGPPAGTAQIVLRQDFFNEVLSTMFAQMKAPSFPLDDRPGNNSVQPTCASVITILPEGSSVRTGISLENNKLGAPLAFTGSYDSMFGCLQFTGWAQARMDLRFEPAQQTVFGVLNVETVNLDGVNPVLSGLLTPLVQSTLNTRVNPVRIIDGRQIAINVPIAATQSNLVANVQDVRAEVKDSALNLFVTYNFASGPFTGQDQHAP
jgi:hypothetical protein